MRCRNITLMGKEYPCVFSNRVLLALEEADTDFDSLLSEISDGKHMKKLFWLLALMLNAGQAWKKEEGIETDAPPTIAEIMNRTTPDECIEMWSGLLECYNASMNRKVETEDSKNGNATQSEA